MAEYFTEERIGELNNRPQFKNWKEQLLSF